MVRELDRPGEEKYVLDLNCHIPERLALSAPIDAVLLPRLSDTGRVAVRPTSPTQGLMALAPSTIYQLPSSRGGSLVPMSELLRQVPTYVLELGGPPDQVPGAIAELLARGPAEDRTPGQRPDTCVQCRALLARGDRECPGANAGAIRAHCGRRRIERPYAGSGQGVRRQRPLRASGQRGHRQRAQPVSRAGTRRLSGVPRCRRPLGATQARAPVGVMRPTPGPTSSSATCASS